MKTYLIYYNEQTFAKCHFLQIFILYWHSKSKDWQTMAQRPNLAYCLFYMALVFTL